LLAAVVDRVVAAMGLGERRLLVVADRADHRGTEMLGPLADDETDTAGRGVDQDRLARLHDMGAADLLLGSKGSDGRLGEAQVAALRSLDITVDRLAEGLEPS